MLARKSLTICAFLLIVVAATVAVAPMVFRGNPWGHDFDLHIPAWMEAQQQLREFVFPRWAVGANYGFGEPFFIFYPPLSWMIGSTLGLILPWKIVPGVYVWLVLVLAGAAMWKCAREWLDPSDAVMASLLYALNPYLIVTAYRRCNYAELLASALFPLLVWAGVQMGREARKTILPLSIVLAAIWLADLPVGVIASYSLAFLLLLNSLIHRSLRTILYGAAAILAAFGSIAFFLLPAAWERKWVNIEEAVRYVWAPENNFLFTQRNIPQYMSFNRGLSFIALFLIIIAAIAAVLTRRLRRDAPDVWRLLAALGGISAFMMFPPSLIFYRILPELRFVEFPWRWLSPLCVVGVVLVASAVAGTRRKWALWMTVAFVFGAVGAGIVHNVSWDSHANHLKNLLVMTHSGVGSYGANWSGPLGSDPSKLPKTAPLVASTGPNNERETSTDSVAIHVEKWSPEHKLFSVDSPRPILLQMKLLAYPAWQAKLSGKIVLLETDHETGQMLLPVPAGFSRTEINFARTWDRTVGIAVSLTTVLALILLMFSPPWRESIARAARILPSSERIRGTPPASARRGL